MSTPPHDWFLCLEINAYFDHEHDVESIPETGFIRSLPLKNRDIMCAIHFNGDPESPEFYIEASNDLSESEVEEASAILDRILGLSIDLRPFLERASSDIVLGDLLMEFYGFKRLARASLFEDATNRIIQTQIAHRPTARKMVYGVRQAYGNNIDFKGEAHVCWARPQQLIGADASSMKKYGLSLRKGEYIIGLAHEFISGRVSEKQLESLAPSDFYTRLRAIRGIGPTTAQDLLLFRNRPDAIFPSNLVKKQERGLRRWIILSYGEDPDRISEKDFSELIKTWEGYQACALEYLFMNWVVSERKKGRNF